MAGVLIVDDASFMRRVIRKILESEGYEIVGEATDGLEAVEQYALLRPDLVTMDIVMPKCSGINALEAIMREDPRACIVICSALGQEALVEEALKAGARDFIVKPFKRDQVISSLGQALAPTG
ncbi:MAG: two-component system response regulator [Deltaproteobacteria bacterium]|nr:two-component system response regulator [Deltaproteobacteria bacterium]